MIEGKRIRKKVYESFNAEVFYFHLSQSQSMETEKLYNEIYPGLKTKRDVEDLKVGGLWVGDLLYDSHLRKWLLPTVDIEDYRFQNSLRDTLGYYVYWRDYLDSHDVKSVIVSHGVYHWYAIILRLAIQRDIPCYQINATTLYYLSKEYFQPYAEFYDYPKEFRELTPEQQRCGLKAAKERLDRRKAGDVGVDMWYSSKSAFLRKGNKRILPESPRIKVLIPPHCFFDSPHPFGKNLFPDFYEWLTFLGDISEKTDYDWYIKTHPDFIPANIPIIEQFLSKYPKFTLISPESSHLQLIDDGLDFVLTVYGTVGSEYASSGIPVISASTCNPHIAYNFNIHPKTIEEYEKILMDLHNQELDIDINEVYEHYYMKNLDDVDNWLFIDYETFLKESGGYWKQVGSVSYQKFIEEFSERRHKQILRVLDKFVESKEYRLRRKHLEPERNVCSCLV